MDLSTTTASVLMARMAGGELGSGELLEALLAHVDEHNPALGAVVAFDRERARKEAQRADEARAQGEALGLLHGLPMTIKDTFETEGLVTTSGSRRLADHVPDRDADAVANLKAAGAVIFGKTNVPLFAGDWQSVNDVYGQTNNPWDVRRTPGGSSGGAAAAVAAGMSPAELGSDIGGSIRIPASFCGIYGHKPTHGAVSMRGHIPGAPGMLSTSDLAVAGPLARSVDDLELLMSVLTSAESFDGVPGAALPQWTQTAIADLRIGLWVDDNEAPVDRTVKNAVSRFVDRLSDAGARIVEDVRPRMSSADLHDVYRRLIDPIIAADLPPRSRQEMADLAHQADADEADPKIRQARYALATHRDWLSANERRAIAQRNWEEVFNAVDVMLTPSAPVTAFPHDTDVAFSDRTLLVNGQPKPYSSLSFWSSLANMPLLPATALPVGLGDGLPVGVQLIGPRYADRTTMGVARMLTELTDMPALRLQRVQ